MGVDSSPTLSVVNPAYPKRQKLDVKPILQSKKLQYDNCSHSYSHIHILRIQENCPFEVISEASSSSKNFYSPPGEVAEVEGSDYQSFVAPGGRLWSFCKVWLENSCHPRVGQILQWGYRIVLQ